VRIAFVGCGNVLGAYLAAAERLRQQHAATVVALCGPERRRARALELGIPSFSTDYAEVLARPDIDAVVILTPMREHAAMTSAALEAGKHVLVEKPFATTLEEGRELIALAARSPGLLVCAPFTVLSQTFQAIARRVRNGDLGKVVAARGRYGWAGPDWADWFYRPGGGALFDLGVYNLTSLTGWLGPVQRVSAMAGAAVPERLINGRSVLVEAEDNAQLLLDFGGSCYATILTGFCVQQYRGPGLELFGTEGTVYMLGDDWDPDGYELWQNRAGCWQCFKETQPDWPWTDGLGHLVECIREQRRPLTTPDHALHVLEVMLEAKAAARDGITRSIQSTFTLPEFESSTAGVAAHRVHDRTRSE
jgi:predicted dehydrogenase